MARILGAVVDDTMSELSEVALHCACGGRLVITGLTNPSQMVDVLTLTKRFDDIHKNHGSAGVREPRNPLPDKFKAAYAALEARARGVTP